jgi:sugar phosphate isomerase/epimerase
MKLAVITDEISQDFEHALDVMKEFNVKSAELRGLWDTNIADLDPAQVTRAKVALARRGMSVCCLSTPVLKCDLEPIEAEEAGAMHLAQTRTLEDQGPLLRRCCEIAKEVGAPYIRIFSGWYRGELTPEIEAKIVAAIADLIPIAEEAGITLVLENEHACYVRTGEEAARILAALNNSRVRGCWDAGNAFQAGETAYPNGYEAIRPYLLHVHVKDARTEPDGTLPWTVLGHGEIGYDEQFAALERDGYSGYISLETHYRPENGSPEQGSRECLTALRRWIKE